METFEHVKSEIALTEWEVDCQRRMLLKFPLIDFESNCWPIKSLYNTNQIDWYFSKAIADFESRDLSFSRALRCLIAEMVITGSPKSIHGAIKGFRLLKNSTVLNIFELNMSQLRNIEDECLVRARLYPNTALASLSKLLQLEKDIYLLAKKQVIGQLAYGSSPNINAELYSIGQKFQKGIKKQKTELLNLQIEALNDAIECLLDNDPRLNSGDRVAIGAMLVLMMAPSRINEPLCCSIDDNITIEGYVNRGADRNSLNRAHQMLILTMKGSKGAEWTAKPALAFMIDVYHYAMDVIKQHGQISRELITWYESNPNKIYLPEELEYLRGKPLTHNDLAKIVELRTDSSPINGATAYKYMKDLDSKSYRVKMKWEGNHNSCMKQFVPFDVAEAYLIEKIQGAMKTCRRVTILNHYQGKLSKMLFLYDGLRVPYLPGAFSYALLSKHLKVRDSRKIERPNEKSLFEKLGITMPVNGKIETAWIDTHDPRRWLTTMAKLHGENLSDVLINKWSNRKRFSQLGAYDMRSNDEKAKASAMPNPTELADLSHGLTKVREAGEAFGLKPQIFVVNTAQVSLTSMSCISQAVNDRPVAKVSNQIAILYPNWFGVCLHQHHESPCRRYNSCLPCDNHVTVKGDQKTNQAIRDRQDELIGSILLQLERLVREHNRGIADEPDELINHVLSLVTDGLNVDEMAEQMIDEFHSIVGLIKDKRLSNMLHEAFVAKGTIRYLNDNEIENGAIIKYHNPTNHEAPTLERGISASGGREYFELSEQKLVAKHPEFGCNLSPFDHIKYNDLQYSVTMKKRGTN